MPTSQLTVSQHDRFASATERRKHCNLLLLDRCKEIERRYGLPDSGAQFTFPLPDTHVEIPQAVDTGKPKAKFGPVYMTSHGSQEALEMRFRIRNPRNPSGSTNSGVNVALLKDIPLSTVYPTSLTITALTGGSIQPRAAPPAATTTTVTADRVTEARAQTAPAALGASPGEPPSWLMPWQTGSRAAGRDRARIIIGKRNPSGGFLTGHSPFPA